MTTWPSRSHMGEGAKMESSPSSLCGLGLPLTPKEMTRRYQATSGTMWSDQSQAQIWHSREEPGLCAWKSMVWIHRPGYEDLLRHTPLSLSLEFWSASTAKLSLLKVATPMSICFSSMEIYLSSFKSVCIYIFKYHSTYVSPYIICCHSCVRSVESVESVSEADNC